ncbi:hypothetical protein OEZ86_004275 [Tetradesmus obliquus]|nr:hypothetical protein OEZ86_004275 [Tetradesmus obliquus]
MQPRLLASGGNTVTWLRLPRQGASSSSSATDSREPPQTFQQSKKYSFTPLETQRTLTKHPRRWFLDIHRQHGTRRPRSTAGARAQGGDVSAPATSSSDSRSKGAAAQAAPRGC